MTRALHLAVAAVAILAASSSCGPTTMRALDAAVDAFGQGDATAQGGGGTGIDSRSGSRLQMRRIAYTGADGSRLDTGATEITDSMLGARCTPNQAEDGALRCLPYTGAIVSTYFSDAACSAPLAYYTQPGCTPAYATEFLSYVCPGPGAQFGGNALRVFRVGAEFTGTPYARSGAACVTTTAGAAFRLFAVTPMPATDFVSMALVP